MKLELLTMFLNKAVVNKEIIYDYACDTVISDFQTGSKLGTVNSGL
jgi:hypothetical protein